MPSCRMDRNEINNETSDLDYILIKINKTDIHHALQVDEIFEKDYPLTEFEKVICLEKLRDEGFCKKQLSFIVNKVTGKREDVEDNPGYYITYDGWLLLQRFQIKGNAPYTNQNIKRNIKSAYTEIIKTIPIGIAFIAILFTYAQFKLSNKSFEELIKSKELEKELKEQKLINERNKIENDSLRSEISFLKK